MKTLGQIFDAIDARMPASDWDGLAADLEQLFQCDFINYYAAGIPGAPRSADEVIMTNNRVAMADYYERGIYQHLLMREDEIPQFAPFKGSDIVPPDSYAKQLHYTSWGRKYGCFHMVIAPLMLSPAEVAVLVFARGQDKEDFNETDCHRAGLSARYLRRFVQAQRVAHPGRYADLIMEFASPVAILDPSAVVVANDAFADWCRDYRVAVTEGNGGALTFSDPDVSARVGTELQRLRQSRVDTASPAKSQMTIAVPSAAGRKFNLQFIPLTDGPETSDRFICFVHSANPTLTVASYGEKIGLTESEIEIFSQLAQGISARSISDLTDRRYATVRWHIQNILTKAGVTSQKELLSKLFNEVERL